MESGGITFAAGKGIGRMAKETVTKEIGTTICGMAMGFTCAPMGMRTKGNGKTMCLKGEASRFIQ